MCSDSRYKLWKCPGQTRMYVTLPYQSSYELFALVVGSDLVQATRKTKLFLQQWLWVSHFPLKGSIYMGGTLRFGLPNTLKIASFLFLYLCSCFSFYALFPVPLMCLL